MGLVDAAKGQTGKRPGSSISVMSRSVGILAAGLGGESGRFAT